MIFYKESITFDEIHYNPIELRDWWKPFGKYKKTLHTKGTNGTCDICDVPAAEGRQVHDYPIVQTYGSMFTPLPKESLKSDYYARIFTHEPGQGILPHIDQASNCAIIFPIIPNDPSPVIYLNQGDKQYLRGGWWDWSDFTLADIDYVHGYTLGHPSLINSQLIHAQRNTGDSIRAILRFKISWLTYEECVEMCKNGTFLDMDKVNEFNEGSKLYNEGITRYMEPLLT
jgi:hypothetical protein